MTEESPRTCFICVQETLNAVPIMNDVDANQDELKELSESTPRGSVIAKHFWFEMDDLLDNFICCNCWTKINEFHQFYRVIEETHEQKMHFSVLHIKEEIDFATETEQELQENQHNPMDDGQQSCSDSIAEKNDTESTETCVDVDQSLKPTEPRTDEKKLKLIDRMAKADKLIAKYCSMVCDNCSLEFPSFTALQTHSAEAHKTRAYVFCCDRKFNTRTRLFDHVQRHLNPAQFQCDICKRKCVDSEGLRRHKLKVHTPFDERPFKCDKCSKAFISETLLTSHRNYHIAIETKEFPCQYCDRFFGNSSLLKAHERNTHASTFEYVCDTCAKGFNQRGLFLRHLQEHEPKGPEEKVQCPICTRWLLKVSMNKHLLRHNSPSYQCDICGKESPNVLAHRSHKQFAHKDATFTCNICGKVFKRALTLREHIAAHSGETLYTCPYCPKTFNSNANMHSHRKKMHHQEWLESKIKRFAKHEQA